MKEYCLSHGSTCIRYHDFAGDGLPLVFIHGLGCASSFDYPSVVSSGLWGRRCLLPDLPGSGFSDKPENFPYTISFHAACLRELLVAEGAERCIIFGHSMGGAIAIELARLCGENVAALFLAEANLDSGGGPFSCRIAKYSEGEYCRKGHSQMIMRSRLGGNAKWAATLMSSLPQAVHRESVSLIAGGTPSWRESLYALECPKGYIWGERSLPHPDRDVLTGHGVMEEVVPDAGHLMAWDNPAGLASAICRLLVQCGL